MTLVPTATDRWRDDATGLDHIALGNGSMPLNYQDGGQWRDIDCSWAKVGQMYRAVQSFHKAIMLADGTLGVQWPTSTGLKTIRSTPDRLIRFDTSDRSWETLALANPSPMFSAEGGELIAANVYPDIHRRASFFNHRMSDGYIFTQAARDNLRNLGGWAGKWLGTVSRLDVSGMINPEFFDDDGVIAPDDVGRLSRKYLGVRVAGERVVNMVGGQRIFGPLGVSVNIDVRKLLVVRGGVLYLVELFDPVAVNALPDGDIRHNDEFGYNGTGATTTTLEDFIVGTKASPSSSGTVTSITAIVSRNGKFGSPVSKCALYNFNGGSADTLVTNSATDEVTVDSIPDPQWRTYTFPGSDPTVTGGADYFICAWADDTGPSMNVLADVDAELGETMGFHGLTYNGFPSSATFSDVADNRVSIYATYTPSAAGLPLGGLALMGAGR